MDICVFISMGKQHKILHSWNNNVLRAREIIKRLQTVICLCYILTDAMIKTHAGRLLYKYIYLSLYCKGSKRVPQGLRVRGSWRPNRTEIFWPPLLWPSALCFSCSPDAQPEAQRPTLLGDGFLYCISSASSLNPNSIGGPEPLRPGVAFLTTSRL